jgi:hypothetical protein
MRGLCLVLDLNLLPIQRQGGQEQIDLAGLYAATPPRRAARGREQDNLILYLTLLGGAPMPADQQAQMLTRLAQLFYRTPGAVTTALRAQVELLNKTLLEGNLRNPAGQVIGLLTQMVLRGETVYLTHSGPGHAFLLTTTETQDFADEENAGSGLGLSRTPVYRHFQFSLHANEFVFLTHQSAESWAVDKLRISANQGMEGLRRRLLIGRTDPELNAVLVQAISGSGKLRLLRLKSTLRNMAQPQTSQPAVVDSLLAATAAVAAEQPITDIPEQAQPMPTVESLHTEAVPVVEVAATDFPAGGLDDTVDSVIDVPIDVPLEAAASARSSPTFEIAASVTEKAESITTSEQAVPKASAARQQPTPRYARTQAAPRKPSAFPGKLKSAAAALLKMLAAFQAALGSALRQVGGALWSLLRRIMPDEAMLNLSPKTLVFLAVAVPVVISVIGGMVYIERGQAAQYQQYYDQAVELTTQAAAKTDPLEQRLAWQSTLELLDKAEFYRLTPESQALRTMARNSLDVLDGIERLDFQPALIGNLDKNVNITRIAATGGDLYLLNSSQGNVIRAVLTGGGYQVDTQFVCGPVSGGAAVVGPIMDIMALPRGEETGASLMGVDASGTIILCIAGDPPLIQPVNPPATNFGEIRGIELNTGDLYMLDPSVNAVWIYRGRDTVNPPRLFFGEQVPYMPDVVDLSVNDDDLYLLHADGHLSLCSYQDGSDTLCEDPYPFVDLRPGRSGGPVIPDAIFNQIQFSPPPDPSLYLLEPETSAIYHFSLRLVLQRQYRPLNGLAEGRATAFLVSTSRMAFLAVGNQVYFAALP